ncbi:MAG: Fic family protein [Candidatus Krumholzibacteria bacterium]|jgi:Fic family protein|nr:Fic family protein [Candidatus Krumholzibacteria bacterium]MDP7022089.1 Fic family protein [Candidatus Krumholzibacteria bacterium]
MLPEGNQELLAGLKARCSAWPQRLRTVSSVERRWHAAWCNAGIEGNPLSWSKARSFLESEEEAKDLPHNELQGCRLALDFLEDGMDLRMGELRHLHQLISRGQGKSGEFRNHPVEIVRESGPGAGEAVFRPPHHSRVPALMEDLLEQSRRQAEEGMNPFVLAGLFHYEFQSIHPFSDGNGRVGRILTTFLARQGWDSEDFYLAPALRKAGSAYYLALRSVRRDYEEEAGIQSWLEPFLGFCMQALDDEFLPGAWP